MPVEPDTAAERAQKDAVVGRTLLETVMFKMPLQDTRRLQLPDLDQALRGRGAEDGH